MENLKFHVIRKEHTPERVLDHLKVADTVAFDYFDEKRNYIIGSADAVSINGDIIDGLSNRSVKYVHYFHCSTPISKLDKKFCKFIISICLNFKRMT